jgi:FkbM family methyltransferase
MKQAHGWWFPDHEQHLIEWLAKNGKQMHGRSSYQWAKIEAALAVVPEFGVAVDIGGHVGLWSYYLAMKFVKVHAFEPMAAHRECFEANLAGADNVVLHDCALGDEVGSIRLKTGPNSSGDTYVDGKGDIPLKLLDSFGLTGVDFIKADCEGYELFAMRGAEQTIRRWRPTIIVEQKPGRAQKYGLHQTEAVGYLRGLGYKLVKEMAGDFIMTAR